VLFDTISKKTGMLFVTLQFLVMPLMGCTGSSSSPHLASWSEQFVTARGIVGIDGDYVLLDAAAFPVRRATSASGEPIELAVTLVFESTQPMKDAAGGTPGYAMQSVGYDDYHLPSTLKGDEVSIGRPFAPPPEAIERESMVQIGPQDALQVTLAAGEAYMGAPVDHGNTEIRLNWDISQKYPDLQGTLVPVWEVVYFRDGNSSIWLVDAQTGTILKNGEETN
jgi:hypothetical protein